MKKKNDKIVMLLIFMIAFAVMSWVIDAGDLASGQFASLGKIRAGLYDLLLIVCSALAYKVKDIFYILIVGGCYGVLSQTKGYRKLIDKTAKLIKNKDSIAMLMITLVMGLYVSISSEILTLFCIVPFIISVFLRNKHDKVTAINAGFGGMFIGYLGLSFGTFGLTYLNEATGLGVTEWIFVKWLLFVLAYVLFNIFSVLYMKKHKMEKEVSCDLYYCEELNDSKVKKINRTKLWPTILVGVISLIFIIIAYINWNESFGIDKFDVLHKNFQEFFKIGDVSVFSSITGTEMPAIGKMEDLLGVSLVIIFATIILSLFDNLKIDSFIDNFANGCKKISKVAFIYGFAFIALFLTSSYPWPITVINKIFGNGSFNIFLLLIVAFLSQIVTTEPGYCGFLFGPYLAQAYVSNIEAAGLIWRLGSALAFLIGPTSYILLAALTYVDVSYQKWLKYIWKFALLFTLLSLIILAIICYM